MPKAYPAFAWEYANILLKPMAQHKLLRTLAASESVAKQCAKHTLVEQGLLISGGSESSGGAQVFSSRDSEPGVAASYI